MPRIAFFDMHGFYEPDDEDEKKTKPQKTNGILDDQKVHHICEAPQQLFCPNCYGKYLRWAYIGRHFGKDMPHASFLKISIDGYDGSNFSIRFTCPNCNFEITQLV